MSLSLGASLTITDVRFVLVFAADGFCSSATGSSVLKDNVWVAPKLSAPGGRRLQKHPPQTRAHAAQKRDRSLCFCFCSCVSECPAQTLRRPENRPRFPRPLELSAASRRQTRESSGQAAGLGQRFSASSITCISSNVSSSLHRLFFFSSAPSPLRRASNAVASPGGPSRLEASSASEGGPEWKICRSLW